MNAGLPLFSLEGRTALITGASGHLGRAMAAQLGAAGAKIILNGRDSAKLEALAEDLRTQNISCDTSPFDIMDDAAIADAMGKLSGLNILINNAYTGRAAAWNDATNEDFETAFRSGVTAAFNLARAARSHLKAEMGSVINIASMYGHIAPDPGIYGDTGLNSPPHYNAAKGGLIQLTRYLATHWAGDGIRVNAISPGPFPVPAIQDERPDFIEKLASKTALGRIGAASEVAGAAHFLASDAASYVTGVNLPVDGGWSAW